MDDTVLKHFGVLGMKWGVRKDIEKVAYSIGAKVNPRETRYRLQKIMNNPNANKQLLSQLIEEETRRSGTLPTNKAALKAVESVGIKKHKEAVYSNLTNDDLNKLKTYTDSARYSRSINSFLATGEPEDFSSQAESLKNTIRKNKINNQTVYRSCNLKFSTKGIAKKLDDMSEEELADAFGKMSKNFAGKSLKENRIFSTSTSPLFAIDTWRAVNPTAASTYNTYMVINCKKTHGLYADGKTKDGKSLVNTRSNQECILAPEKLTYRRITYDTEREMFAIIVDAESD